MVSLDDGLPSPAGTRDIFDNLTPVILERTSSMIPPWSEPEGRKLRDGLGLDRDAELFITAVVLKHGYRVFAAGPRFEDRHGEGRQSTTSIPIFAGVDGVPILARVIRVDHPGSTAIAVFRWYDLTGPLYSTHSRTPQSDAEAVEINRRFALVDEAAALSWAQHASAPPPPPWNPQSVPDEKRAHIAALVLKMDDDQLSSERIARRLKQEGPDVAASTVRSWIPILRRLREYKRRMTPES